MKATLNTLLFTKSTIALPFLKSSRSYKETKNTKTKTFSGENVLVCFGWFYDGFNRIITHHPRRGERAL